MTRKRVLFLSNHVFTLYSFRKEMIKEMREVGHELFLSMPKSDDEKYFIDLGCHIVHTSLERRGINPIKDIKLLVQYKKIIKEINPDIIFSFTIKPNIYGSIVSNKLGYKQVCNITGTGATFLQRNLLSRICEVLYRISVKNAYNVFFQNKGDREYFIKHKMIKDNYAMLPGSGCNLNEHIIIPFPKSETINFLFVGRVMKLKGIDEYLECAKIITKRYPNTKFYIAGWNEQPQYMELVKAAQDAGAVEYLGFCKDIDTKIANVHCVVLPSHGGEGVPNVLLEASAIGRPVIASKINGSMDVVDDGLTGYLFNTGEAKDLVKQVERFLAMTQEEKISMGLAGRKKVEREFDRKTVIKMYMNEVNNA